MEDVVHYPPAQTLQVALTVPVYLGTSEMESTAQVGLSHSAVLTSSQGRLSLSTDGDKCAMDIFWGYVIKILILSCYIKIL